MAPRVFPNIVAVTNLLRIKSSGKLKTTPFLGFEVALTDEEEFYIIFGISK